MFLAMLYHFALHFASFTAVWSSSKPGCPVINVEVRTISLGCCQWCTAYLCIFGNTRSWTFSCM
jgi:hypothetical protein